MTTFIWLDHDIEDPRQIVVCAETLAKARQIVINEILPEVKASKKEWINWSIRNELREKDPARIQTIKVENKKRDEDMAECHILDIINRLPDYKLDINDYFYEGYFSKSCKP
jgi:hypothetical protein